MDFWNRILGKEKQLSEIDKIKYGSGSAVTIGTTTSDTDVGAADRAVKALKEFNKTCPLNVENAQVAKAPNGLAITMDLSPISNKEEAIKFATILRRILTKNGLTVD
jgi:hypothetical protein